MGKYLLRRLIIAIPTLLLISFVIFAILSLGLDQPWPIRYVKWITAAAQGDLGYSFNSKIPVMSLIWQRLPNTLAVLGVAYILSVILALPIGIISAVKRYSIFDHAVTTFA